jgi:hypothetical protein
MSTVRLASTVVGLSAVLAVSGCSNPLEDAANNLVEQGVERAVEEGTGGDVDLDLDLDGSGASLPDDWPADVVLPDGKVLLALSQDDVLMVQVSVSGPESFDEMVANFESAGFVEGESLDNEVMSIRFFERDDLGATASMLDLDGDYVLQVTMTPQTS